MADRFTQAEQGATLRNLHAELVAANIIPEDCELHLQTGSPTYGHAWRLHCIPAGQTGLHRVPGFYDYLGQRGADARRVLSAYAEALQAARRIREGDTWHVRQADNLRRAAVVS